MHNNKIHNENEVPTLFTPPELLTTGQAASELKLAPGTLQNWRSKGQGPKFRKRGRNVYYHIKEIERYKKEEFCEYGSTSEWKEINL